MVGRLPSLDGLRGVAILFVVVSHSWLGTDSIYWPRYVGLSGVQLFFVLSGFLITGILLDAKGAAHYFRNFYVRRVLRIFPLYYFVIAGTFGLAAVLPQIAPPVDIPKGQEWTYWTFLSNFSMATAGQLGQFAPVTWSLAIEEQYYLIWAPIVLLLPRRALLYVCALIYGGALAWRWVLFATHSWSLAGTVLLPAQMDSLAVGGFIAVLLRSDPGLRMLSRLAPWALAVGTAVLMLNAVRAGASLPTNPDATTVIVSLSMYPLSYGSLLVLAITWSGSPLSAVLQTPLLRTVGRYSYGMYLLHYPILIATLGIGQNLVASRHVAGQLGYTGLLAVLAVAAAWLSWCGLEQPFQRLKRLFEAGEPGAKDRDSYTLTARMTGVRVGPWRFEIPELGLGLDVRRLKLPNLKLRATDLPIALALISLVPLFVLGPYLATAPPVVSVAVAVGACTAGWLAVARPGFALVFTLDAVALYLAPHRGYWLALTAVSVSALVLVRFVRKRLVPAMNQAT